MSPHSWKASKDFFIPLKQNPRSLTLFRRPHMVWPLSVSTESFPALSPHSHVLCTLAFSSPLNVPGSLLFLQRSLTLRVSESERPSLASLYPTTPLGRGYPCLLSHAIFLHCIFSPLLCICESVIGRLFPTSLGSWRKASLCFLLYHFPVAWYKFGKCRTSN